MDETQILTALKRLHVPHEAIAAAINRERPAATKLMNSQRAIKASEIPALVALIREWENRRLGITVVTPADNPRAPDTPRQHVTPPAIEYVPVPILPTFAGMGGGGNGDGDVETALVPRRLIEQELRGRAADFLVINVRGDSMEPDFHHGDQLLVDTRDKNPTQPGPFALQVEGSYLVKNVERTRDGLRLFSSNTKYREEIVSSDDIQLAIIGRPVWFGRKL